MALDAISSFTGQSASTQTNATKSDVVDKQDFLNLLVTQLKNQDPLDPMKGTEFTAQLAQFAALEQLQQISAKLDALGGSQASTQQVGSNLNYLDRTVSVDVSSVLLRSGETAQVPFTLAEDAAQAIFTFYDAEGHAVRTVDAGALAAGAQSFAWDGLDDSGQPLSEGNYTVSIRALDSQGQPVNADTQFSGQVTGITYENGIAYLVVGGRRFAVSSVVGVTGTPASSSTAANSAATTASTSLTQTLVNALSE